MNYVPYFMPKLEWLRSAGHGVISFVMLEGITCPGHRGMCEEERSVSTFLLLCSR